MEMEKLPVMESFYTVQGEGAHTGKAAYFIRLAGCDVGCTWCDVKESWAVQNDQWMEIDTIVSDTIKYPSNLVVITGGEPCMYNLVRLLDNLKTHGRKVHLETSGAYPLQGEVDWICVSPKKFKPALPEMIQMADELKFVINHPSDLKWAEDLSLTAKPSCQFYLQPEFGKSNKMMGLIVDYVKSNPQWRISLQTHKFLGIP
ncbi:MAG: 7-carboxy-7-deazaguanine synthase QueE [Bacteroidota bacterium]